MLRSKGERAGSAAFALAIAAWLALVPQALALDPPGSAPADGNRLAEKTDPAAWYRQLAERSASQAGLPPAIADAVMAVESGYDPHAVGSSGEIGLMQVLPSTARMLGFMGSLDGLAEPETNIRLGVAYLAEAWRLAGKDLCTAVMKYRAGHGEARFSTRSVDYCIAVRAKLMARGYPVTGRVPVADFGEPPRARPCRLGCLAASAGAPPDLPALNSRLSDLARQINVRAIHGL
jgi:soluble lytic murein transglycosylase-like protein